MTGDAKSVALSIGIVANNLDYSIFHLTPACSS